MVGIILLRAHSDSMDGFEKLVLALLALSSVLIGVKILLVE